ncbi:head completion/stabilization protein [Alkalimonas mucilaginosa]|uniref:Head completion/stabilization protein n=1 Tax=Alkalimonas mucilaginosa TaxID=3057676 RepID=A0ABU7JD09_9GAMM|nr:head completion/stabilization protein [Alkalimonas sp. MEB004]MEE2023582.1 head completion/stabilization protein [Alkalimonas sp. MEB004]
MSGFGFQSPAQDSITIDAGSGWPELSTGEFRKNRRIPEYFEEATLADSLNRSVAEVQLQIISFVRQASANTDVALTLDENLAPEFSEQQISIYRGAVYARSHADLLGYFSAVDQKEAGNNKANDADQQLILLAQSNRGIRLLLGLGRAGVHDL